MENQPMMKNEMALRHQSINRLLWQFSVPAIAGTLIVLGGYVIFHLWPEQLIGMFTRDDQKLIKFTSHALLVFFSLIPIMAFQVLGSTYFQAVGKPLSLPPYSFIMK